MENTVDCVVSAAQLAQLNAIAQRLRTTPGDLLVALAFAKLDSEIGEELGLIDHYTQALIGFVDERRVSGINIRRMGQYAVPGVSSNAEVHHG